MIDHYPITDNGAEPVCSVDGEPWPCSHEKPTKAKGKSKPADKTEDEQ